MKKRSKKTMYNKIGDKFVPKGKGPFLMKGFSGFGNDSPAKHDDRDLQRDLRERRAENAKQFKPVNMNINMTPEQSNRQRSKAGMRPLFDTASNYKQSFENFYNLMND